MYTDINIMDGDGVIKYKYSKIIRIIRYLYNLVT